MGTVIFDVNSILATGQTRPSILVLGAENPRIRDLFRAVGNFAKVSFVDIRPITRRPSAAGLMNSWQWRKNTAGDHEATLLVPKRWHKVETAMTRWFCERFFARHGKPDIVVFTWPQLAPLAEHFADVCKVYYCKDPFEYWSWDPGLIRSLETRMLHNVDAVFAVSRALVEDFTPRSAAKVIYLPNAVENSFLAAQPARPATLPKDKVIVGSIGQINVTFDWEFIEQMAAAMPEIVLCFVGNVDEDNQFERQRIIHRLTTIPNILWLGHQPHHQLPAYMKHFDISICLLKPGRFADRRSPLRLYDYLSTDRPIISTDVREAREHLPHLHIAESPLPAVSLVREIVAGIHPVDVVVRRAYIARHTWSTRAAEFMTEMRLAPAGEFQTFPTSALPKPRYLGNKSAPQMALAKNA